MKNLPTNRKNDYMRTITECRGEELEDGKKIIRGKAICYDEATKLFSMGGNDYFEIIERGALDNADTSDVFVKYNHSDHAKVVARNKNGSLKLENREDGLYVEFEVANTQDGNDLYEMVRTGLIDKMSFGFTIAEESYNTETRTWTVRAIQKLYEVSAVPNPAYEGTSLHARRAGEVESRAAEVEASRLEKLTQQNRARAILELNKKNIKY